MATGTAQSGGASGGPDWDPARYHLFHDLRLRPVLDLIARLPAELPAGDVVDLGCGSGAAAAALRGRWPGRRLLGIDASPAMLAEAEAKGLYDALARDDAKGWHPDTPPAVLFSNALLQWLPDHAALLPALAGRLAPGGVLGVQMPQMAAAPSHALMAEIAAQCFLGRPGPAEADLPCHTRPAEDYLRWLSPLGRADVWETEYLQRLPAFEGGHPVRRFTESTTMRPWVAGLEQEERERFVRAYEAALEAPYPREADGSVLFRFRRVFVVLQRDG